MSINDWYDITSNFVKDSTTRVFDFIPNIIGAIIIVAIGLIFAAILKWAIITVLEAIRIQKLFDQIRFTEVMKKAGMPVSIPAVCGEFVKWLTIIIFLIPATKVLYMDKINDLLESLLQYIPNVIIAIAIILIGLIIANAISQVVRAAAAGIGANTANILSVATRYIISIFVIMAALAQLNIPVYLVSAMYTGVMAAFAIGVGLAFGLGGQSAASDLIKKIRDDLKK